MTCWMRRREFTSIAGWLIAFALVVGVGRAQAAVKRGDSPTAAKPLPAAALFAVGTLGIAQDQPKQPIRLNDLRQDNVAGLKSPSKALVLSLLMPGAGHVYAGANTRHRIFFSTEAACWLALGAFTVWGNQKENEFRGWAAGHAGIDPNGKPDDFWRMMTYYSSRGEYEIYGRADEPERPSYPDLVGWDWQWDSDAARLRYRQLRNAAKEADRRATFTIGALVLNRVLAAIDAFRSVKAYNRQKGMQLTHTRIRVKGNPFGTNQNIMLVFERAF